MRLTLILALCVSVAIVPERVRAQSDGDGEQPSFERIEYRITPEISCRPGETIVASATIAAQDPERKRYLLEMTVQETGVVGEDECIAVIGRGCIVEREISPRLLNSHEIVSLSTAVRRILAELPDEPDPFCPLWDPCMMETYTIDGRILPVGPCGSPRLTFEQGDLLYGLLESLLRGDLVLENGDANGDRVRDLSDAVYLLGWLFGGLSEPVQVDCLIAFECANSAVLENGDVNGDRARDVSDAVYLLHWLFLEGPEPLDTCLCL